MLPESISLEVILEEFEVYFEVLEREAFHFVDCLVDKKINK